MHDDRTPFTDIDKRGKPCVRVPLASNKGHATLLPKDYEALKRRRVPFRWHVSSGRAGDQRVRVSIRHRNRVLNLQVGRLIARARPNERLRYLNGNPLDLRSSNLEVSPINKRKRTTQGEHP